MRTRILKLKALSEIFRIKRFAPTRVNPTGNAYPVTLRRCLHETRVSRLGLERNSECEREDKTRERFVKNPFQAPMKRVSNRSDFCKINAGLIACAAGKVSPVDGATQRYMKVPSHANTDALDRAPSLNGSKIRNRAHECKIPRCRKPWLPGCSIKGDSFFLRFASLPIGKRHKIVFSSEKSSHR